jgi:hypothetical protein
MHTTFESQSLKESYHLRDLDVDGMIILKWILKTWGVGVWIGPMLLRIGLLNVE